MHKDYSPIHYLCHILSANVQIVNKSIRVSTTANCNHHLLQLPIKGRVSDTSAVVSCDGGSVDVDVGGIDCVAAWTSFDGKARDE